LTSLPEPWGLLCTTHSVFAKAKTSKSVIFEFVQNRK